MCPVCHADAFGDPTLLVFCVCRMEFMHEIILRLHYLRSSTEHRNSAVLHILICFT